MASLGTGNRMMLQGKRVLVTQADDFMGPVLCDVFREHGAEVVASTSVCS